MKFFTLAAAALALSLSMVVSDAEAAKRLGGGRDTGMQRQTTTEKAPANTTPGQAPNSANATAAAPAAAAAAGTAAAAQSKRSWMGPLAGIAAGLGLAALASHFGFGDELASMLMIGLLVMGVLMVIGFIMRKRAAAAMQSSAGTGFAGAGSMPYATAGAQPVQSPVRSHEVSMPANSTAYTGTPAGTQSGTAGSSLFGSSIGAGVGSSIGSGIGAGVASSAAPVRNIPADFDVAGFVRNAKVQFIRLQAANDAGNLDDIREFTSPEMFAELKMDITERGPVSSVTEVVSIEADVLDVAEETTQHVVSVRFTGLIREDKLAPAEAFDEVWHLTKPRDGRTGWVLSGIQQMQ